MSDPLSAVRGVALAYGKRIPFAGSNTAHACASDQVIGTGLTKMLAQPGNPVGAARRLDWIRAAQLDQEPH